MSDTRLILRPGRARARDFVSFVLATLMMNALPSVVGGQEPTAPQIVSGTELQGAIDRLGDLDYVKRTEAGRLIRRTAPAQAVPALLKAVDEHRDGYVRYRALVLLTAFNDPRTHDVMRDALHSPNDRLRTVKATIFEHTRSIDDRNSRRHR
jgi:hypothetical protein